MATAATPIGPIPASVEAGPVPMPGIAELFAALVAGAGGEQPGGEEAPPEAAPEGTAEGAETLDDAATLLPMLEQQRAAAPAAKLIELPAETPGPARAARVPAAPAAAPPAAKPIERPAEAPMLAQAGVVPASPAAAAAPAAKPIERPAEAPVPARAGPVPAAPVTTPAATADQPGIAAEPRQPVAVAGQVAFVTPEARGQAPVAGADQLPPSNARASESADIAGGKGRVTHEAPAGSHGPRTGPAAPSPVTGDPAKPGPDTDRAPAAQAGEPVASPLAAQPRGAQAAGIPVSAKPQAARAPANELKAELRPMAAARPAQQHLPEAARGDAPPPAAAAVLPARSEALQAAAGSKAGPAATAATAPVEVRPAEPAAREAVTASPAQPSPAAALPSTKPPLPPAPARVSEAKAPELAAAAAEAQKAPAPAKTRAARYAAAPANAEPQRDPAAGTPILTAATEARASVQPLQAIQPLVQPAPAPLSAPAQPAPIGQQMLNLSSGDAWIDQIARDISQTAGKDGIMRFRLTPETLGELRVEITHSERGAHVRLAVTSEQAQQALAAAEPKLAAEARAQGVRIAETEISFAGNQSQGRELGRQAQEQAQAQNGQPARTPRGNAATPSFTDAAEPSRSRRTDRYA